MSCVCVCVVCFGIISLLVFPLIHGSHLSWFLSFVEKSRKCVVCGGGGTAQKKEKEKKDPTMASFAEAPAGDVAKGTLSCLREGVRAIWLRGRARVADKISSLY